MCAAYRSSAPEKYVDDREHVLLGPAGRGEQTKGFQGVSRLWRDRVLFRFASPSRLCCLGLMVTVLRCSGVASGTRSGRWASLPSRPAAACRNPSLRSGSSTGVPALSGRSEEHTSELQSLMRISYAVF